MNFAIKINFLMKMCIFYYFYFNSFLNKINELYFINDWRGGCNCEMDSSQRYHLCSDNAGKTTNKTPNAIK